MVKKFNAQELQKKLAELQQLQAAILGELSGMTNAEKIQALVDAQPNIKPKTPEMESLLQAGYPGMTVPLAERVVKEWETDPRRWPFEEMQKAQAFLAAYEAQPVVSSLREGWKRSRA